MTKHIGNDKTSNEWNVPIMTKRINTKCKVTKRLKRHTVRYNATKRIQTNCLMRQNIYGQKV